MAIIRWDPFRDLVTLRDKMNRLFEDAYSSGSSERDMISNSWSPSVDIYESDKEIVLTAEVPGLSEKDIEIQIEENTLTIKGERKFEKETKEENYHRIERAYGQFCRTFSLPGHVNQDKIKAEHENGVLRILMPKKEEPKPKQVKIVTPSKND